MMRFSLIIQLLLIIILLCCIHIQATDYVDIIGERNSGTNWIASIVSKNFGKEKLLPLTNTRNIYAAFRGLYTTEFGWKHGFLRRDLIGPSQKAQHDVTFIVVFRNPYSWLLSMQRMPHHAPDHSRLDLYTFVSKEWHCYGTARREMKWELNPINQKPYSNVVKLRTAKYKDWLSLSDLVDHVVYLNYETLVADEGMSLVDNVMKQGVKRKSNEFIPEHGRCGAFGWRDGCSGSGNAAERTQRKKKAADEVYMRDFYRQPKALLYVNSQLDEDFEKLLGYTLRYPTDDQ